MVYEPVIDWAASVTLATGSVPIGRGEGGRWPHEARAFWVREPGVGRDPARHAARARVRTRCSCARCAPASAGAPRRWCSGGGAGEPVRRDAGAVPGGRLPRAGQVRLPQRRRGRARTAGAARAHRVLPLPAPDRLRRAGRRRRRRARRRAAARGPCWPAPWRRRSTRCGTPRPLVGDRVTVVGRRHGRLLRRAAARPASRRARWSWSTSTRRGPRSRPRSGVDFAAPADRRRRRDLVVHASATAAGLQRRWTCSPRRAR